VLCTSFPQTTVAIQSSHRSCYLHIAAAVVHKDSNLAVLEPGIHLRKGIQLLRHQRRNLEDPLVLVLDLGSVDLEQGL